MSEVSNMNVEAANELLFESGSEFKREGADPDCAEALLDTMLAYADPEYVEAYELMVSEYDHAEALAQFHRGMGAE